MTMIEYINERIERIRNSDYSQIKKDKLCKILNKEKEKLIECFSIFELNKYWIEDKEKYTFPSDRKSMVDKYYNEYKKLHGDHSIELFEENLKIFIKITLNPYTGDTLKNKNLKEEYWDSREESYKCWVGFIGSFSEAGKYFEAVDNITAYS